VADEIRIDITATDEASSELDRLADRLDDIEDRDVEIPVDADTQAATRALEDVDDQAERLEDRDVDVSIDVDAGDVRGDLAGVEGALEGVEGKADSTRRAVDRLGEGSRTSGNRVADLAGPLGEAEGAASTAGGVFDGLGDLLEDFGPKAGLSADAVGKLSQALGVVGVGVAAGAAIWSSYRESQRKAREEAERLADAQRDINEALAEGDIASAAQDFLDSYSGIEDAARRAGVSVADATRFIIGETDSLGSEYERLSGYADSSSTAQADAFRRLFGPLDDLRTKYDQAGESAGTRATAEQQVAEVLAATEDAVRGATEAEQELVDARIAAADATFAATDAEADFAAAVVASRDAQAALTEAVRAKGPTSDEARAATGRLSDAYRAERDAAINAAQAALRLADDEAKASGATLTAADRTRALNRSLIDSARNATPQARAQIIRYIAEVNDIPLERATEIVASASGLDATERALANLARDRVVNLRPRVTEFVGPEGGGGVPLRAALPGGGGEITPRGRAARGAPAAASGIPTTLTVPVYELAPQVTVQVDARGAIDPYSVGRAVEGALGSWGRVSGNWRPGFRVVPA
jgi:hypothetical protein